MPRKLREYNAPTIETAVSSSLLRITRGHSRFVAMAVRLRDGPSQNRSIYAVLAGRCTFSFRPLMVLSPRLICGAVNLALQGMTSALSRFRGAPFRHSSAAGCLTPAAPSRGPASLTLWLRPAGAFRSPAMRRTYLQSDEFQIPRPQSRDDWR